ncbi:hypothetical protein CYLTODRAFT_419012 [Cylindrobasidium torrendii FP15055 ss-10]|uniref:PIN domain-containing protein n=1 Tax=Cylindrobasidium torrendii FP15055 ss-10 TaxID=1314674 RepID=A0A0D7BM93_9AGAR|nr:hypothetical protein CYLTODRAFT_419012 [Cylindrobasidium torrendii FP15055 ss-10]
MAASPPNKIAMSKALGAAFLNHQVEQLEKSVVTRQPQRRREAPKTPERQNDRKSPTVRSSLNPSPRQNRVMTKKDADIVVVDASVLVHALEQMRKWCCNGREEIVIVPLEVLNTLDLLKHGSTALAQRAREASRLLEAQVGANPRIRVQHDGSYVPWDHITFACPGDDIEASPEWLRRTICSARWEHEHGAETLKTGNPLEVVIATCSTSAPPSLSAERASGTLVASWAKRASIKVCEIKAGQLEHARRVSGEHMQSKRHSIIEDKPEPKKRDPRPRNKYNATHGHSRQERSLVERPLPAVEPTKVIRVLARGEMLPP